MSYGLDDPGFESQRGQEINFFTKRPDLWDPPRLVVDENWGLFTGGKAAGA
jgi:hypothetical protein